LGIVPFSGAKVLGNYLAGVNAVGLNTAVAAAGLALTIPLNLVLVPTWGATGAAWASSMTYLLQTALISFFFLRRTGTHLRSLLGLGATRREPAA
jgi:O-antigen/teichoic acid export membrane protein